MSWPERPIENREENKSITAQEVRGILELYGYRKEDSQEGVARLAVEKLRLKDYKLREAVVDLSLKRIPVYNALEAIQENKADNPNLEKARWVMAKLNSIKPEDPAEKTLELGDDLKYNLKKTNAFLFALIHKKLGTENFNYYLRSLTRGGKILEQEINSRQEKEIKKRLPM